MATKRHSLALVCALSLSLFSACKPTQSETLAIAEPAGSTGYDAMLSTYDYPHPVRRHSFTSQGQQLEMAYMDITASSNSNGKVALLLHGKNFSGAYWAPTIDALTQRGWRVIVPDQVGFGKSSKPRGYQFTFHALVHNTTTLLDALEIDDVTVIGHSMGGMVATRFALMNPERTSKLALLNPIGLEDWGLKVPYQAIDDWYSSEQKKTPAKIKAYMTKSYFDGTWKPEYDPLLAIQAGWYSGPDRESIAWMSALTYDMIFTQPVLYEFGHIKAPTLLIIGTRDRTALGKQLVTPELAATLGDYSTLGQRTRDAIPNAELIELPGVGHVPQYEAPAKTHAALLDFIDD